MGRFTTLLWRETHNSRLLLAGGALGAPAALAAAHLLHWDFGALATAVLLVLFTAILASDLLATEVATGRSHALALLPAPAGLVWRAKFAFLAIATIAAAALVFGCDVLLRAVLGRPEPEGFLFAPARNAVVGLLLAWCAGGVAFFAGSLVPHSFGALFTALFLGSGVVWLDVAAAERLEWLDVAAPPELALALIAFEGALFFAASAVLFCWGRLRFAPRVRPLALGLAAVAFVAIGAAGAGAAAVAAIAAEVPPAPKEIFAIRSSPDGARLALSSDGRAFGKRRSFYVWILDVATGEVRPVLEPRVWISGWQPDGTLAVVRETGPRTMNAPRLVEALSVDPATGAVVKVGILPVRDGANPKNAWGVARASNPRYVRGTGRSIWDVTVEWPARGISHRFASRLPYTSGAPCVVFLPEPGRFLGCDETGRLLAFDVTGGEPRVVSEEPVDHLAPSPDASRLLVRRACRCGRTAYEALDPSTGERVAGPWSGGTLWAEWLPNRADGRWLVLRGPGQRVSLCNVSTGNVVPLDAVGGISSVVSVGADRLAILRADGALDLADLAGTTLRRLHARAP